MFDRITSSVEVEAGCGTTLTARLAEFVTRFDVAEDTIMHRTIIHGAAGEVDGDGVATAGTVGDIIPIDGDAIRTTDGAIGHGIWLLELSSLALLSHRRFLRRLSPPLP